MRVVKELKGNEKLVSATQEQFALNSTVFDWEFILLILISLEC